jgi:hypothetical protein
MRDLLDDQDDSVVDLNRKGRLLNMGLAATFPKLYIYLSDSSVPLVDETYEYDLPTTFLVGQDARGPGRD